MRPSGSRRAARRSGRIGDDADTQTMFEISEELQTMIIVGELDALPSAEEAERLSSEAYRNSRVHVVPGAGHVSTCGGSLNLIRLLRETFPEVNSCGSESSDDAGRGETSEELHGLEERYDNASIGMMPWEYWSEDNYRQVEEKRT